jgi:trehalose 6-phosphate synthase/phosphatase
LLGADYIAFHTYSYVQHFRTSALRVLGLESEFDRIQTGARSVRLDALPIGIAPADFTELLDKDKRTKNRLAELRRRFAGRRVVVAVDRLDYTKGIPERLRTFRRLLATHEDLRGKIVMVQVAVPSRERIPMYEELRTEVDKLVGQINGEFSTLDWSPIVYIRRGVAPTELAALYAIANVAWVSPLRDGLNLVAKEYVACQSDNDGVLVLSEFAGAAAEMGEALLVNPYDEELTAEAVARALLMPEGEKRERMERLRARVLRNNVFEWGERFLSNLRRTVEARDGRATNAPQPLKREQVVAAYTQAGSRLLLLDYDGTLVEYYKRPQDAAPSSELIETLRRLTSDEQNTVAIVSGRRRADLEKWFGAIPKLWLAAEHGALLRSPETSDWQTDGAAAAIEWKERVRPVLEDFTDRAPGSFIEEKEYALVWHHRAADPEFSEWLANELVTSLEQMLADTELRAVRGHKIVEVKPLRANKGEVLARLFAAFAEPEFLLFAGDDRTDEDLFARLSDGAWTIRISGGDNSQAAYRLDTPEEMRALLKEFAALCSTDATATTYLT